MRHPLHIVPVVLALAGIASAPAISAPADLAPARPGMVASVGSDITQQPDPTKKELTAWVSRSAESETVTLNVYFPEDASNVRVSMYNILGKLIETQPVASVSKGNQTFRFQTVGLPTGPYLMVLEAGGKRLVNKVMVSR